MTDDGVMLPAVVRSESEALRPFRRAAGFCLAALVLPVLAYVLSEVFRGSNSDMFAGLIALPAVGLAVIAGIHVIAGTMVLLGSPRGAAR